jgi:hypothetical protein
VGDPGCTALAEGVLGWAPATASVVEVEVEVEVEVIAGAGVATVRVERLAVGTV